MNAPSRRISRSRGFTFLEIIMVVVIIGMLASIVGVNVMKRLKQAKINAARAQIMNIRTGLNLYYMHISEYPTTEQGLEALMKCPQSVSQDVWDGPYLDEMESIPKTDPWGEKPYIYKSPGDKFQEYDLYSAGPDKVEGTEDDVWE